MDTEEDPTERLLKTISQRIDEDLAFVYADFCDSLAGSDKPRRETLVVNLLVQRLDIAAHWHLFLVPRLLSVDGFVETIEDLADTVILGNLRRVPRRWRVAKTGRISYWKGMALKWARSLPTTETSQVIPNASARSIIGRWLKANNFKHVDGAKHFGFDPKVLSALKRGTALKEGACGPQKVRDVAEKVGCRPEQLDGEYLRRIKLQKP